MVVYHAQNNIIVFSNIQRLKNYVLSCNFLIYFFPNVTTWLITFKLWISNKLVSLLYLCQGDALCYKRNQSTLYPLNVHIVNTIIIVKTAITVNSRFSRKIISRTTMVLFTALWVISVSFSILCCKKNMTFIFAFCQVFNPIFECEDGHTRTQTFCDVTNNLSDNLHLWLDQFLLAVLEHWLPTQCYTTAVVVVPWLVLVTVVCWARLFHSEK